MAFMTLKAQDTTYKSDQMKLISIKLKISLKLKEEN